MEKLFRQIGDNAWAAVGRVRFMGLPITCRMTVIKLPSGLWLHSPIELGEVRSRLDELGPVTWRVAPNMMHHMFQLPYQEAYPASRLAAPAGLAGKRGDLRIDVPLSSSPPEWADWIETKQIAGNPTLDESVFLHKETKTLILTDLAAHIGDWDHWAVRLYARLNGCYGRLALSYGLKAMFRDRKAAKASVREVLQWDFDRIIPAHGPIIETGGKEALRSAFEWLLQE